MPSMRVRKGGQAVVSNANRRCAMTLPGRSLRDLGGRNIRARSQRRVISIA
jgi:hypothetical protein